MQTTTTAIRWTSDRGAYFSEDGQWNIQRELAYTSCDGPHPAGKGNYHEGGEEHEYEFWQLSHLVNGNWQKVDAGDTLREMKHSAEAGA